MEQNQNYNEPLHQQNFPALEVKENLENLSPIINTSEAQGEAVGSLSPAPSPSGHPQLNADSSADDQPQTTDNPLQTDSMEVHKHPHDILHKKKWSEYLLEFFMIFFAVTLGFFAETLRETTTEHKRAREFAASMIKDLQADTAQLKIYKDYFTIASNNIDTLMQLLTAAEPKDIPSGKLYWYGLWGGANRLFIPNDATFQQMKSSGSLRFFEKKVANDVARYDRFCRLIQDNDEKQRGVYVEVRKNRALIFDFRYNDIANGISQQIRRHNDYSMVDSFMKTNPPLMSYDKVLFNQYVELVRSRYVRNYISNSDSLLKQASVLIGELKKEYHLESD